MLNTNSPLLAALLGDAKQGTFTGITTRLKGQTRGGVVYGNHLICAVIYTGFRYRRLIQRSLEALDELDPKRVLWDLEDAGAIGWVRAPRPSQADVKAAQDAAEARVPAYVGGRYRQAVRAARKAAKATAYADWSKGKQPVVPDLDCVIQAIAELRTSFLRTLAGTNNWTARKVFETLDVGGRKVRGAQVYLSNKAEAEGTIYLNGLMIGCRVIEPAPNGSAPAPKSNPVVAAKRYINRRLPRHLYAKFALPKGGDWLLNAGGTASAMSSATGIEFSPEISELIDQHKSGQEG